MTKQQHQHQQQQKQQNDNKIHKKQPRFMALGSSADVSSKSSTSTSSVSCCSSWYRYGLYFSILLIFIGMILFCVYLCKTEENIICFDNVSSVMDMKNCGNLHNYDDYYIKTSATKNDDNKSSAAAASNETKIPHQQHHYGNNNKEKDERHNDIIKDKRLKFHDDYYTDTDTDADTIDAINHHNTNASAAIYDKNSVLYRSKKPFDYYHNNFKIEEEESNRKNWTVLEINGELTSEDKYVSDIFENYRESSSSDSSNNSSSSSRVSGAVNNSFNLYYGNIKQECFDKYKQHTARGTRTVCFRRKQYVHSLFFAGVSFIVVGVILFFLCIYKI